MAKKTKGPTLEESMRGKIAACLPDAIDCALQSYREFYQQDHQGNAKNFATHHSACKTAIAHIDLLMKLAVMADLPRGQGEDSDLAALLADAQQELQNYHDTVGE